MGPAGSCGAPSLGIVPTSPRPRYQRFCAGSGKTSSGVYRCFYAPAVLSIGVRRRTGQHTCFPNNACITSVVALRSFVIDLTSLALVRPHSNACGNQNCTFRTGRYAAQSLSSDSGARCASPMPLSQLGLRESLGIMRSARSTAFGEVLTGKQVLALVGLDAGLSLG